jgi:tetratricopeptide (TPR) repeat protein
MPGLNPLIISKINEANNLYKDGDIDGAVNSYIAILDELDEAPGGRYKSTEARLIVMSLYKIYFSREDFLLAKKWAEEVFKFDVPERATSELINLGAAHLKLGEFSEAYECFLKAYEKGNQRAFKEEDPEYWKFFKSRNI